MVASNEPPKFLSISFHTKFFPFLLWQRLRPGKSENRSPLAEHVAEGVPMEFTILTVLSIGATFFGAGAALGKNSVIGWIFGILGVGGFIALLINSIRSQEGCRPSFDLLRIPVFFFFIILGITIGIYIGKLEHSCWLGILFGLTGLLAGYIVGILAGLWIQYLGWMAKIFDLLAGLAIIGVVILDLVLLFG